MIATPLPQLHPLNLGELLDQAIRLYRRNFLTFIGIIATVQIPITALQVVASLFTVSAMPNLQNSNRLLDSSSPMFGAAYFIGMAASVLVTIISFVLIQGLATAALTRAVAGSYLGESVGLWEAYEKIGRSWLSLLGALLLAGLIALGLVIWFIIPCVGWLTGGGILAFFGGVIVPLIAPVIVLEKQSAFHSIRRAWDLSRRRFWWVLGFVLILYIFAQLVITGPVTLIGVAFQFVAGGPLNLSMTAAIIQTVLQSLVQLTFSVIYLPLQIAAITLMYFDLRVRTEGFDLTVLSTDALDNDTGIIQITTQAPPPEQGNLVTMTEMGYFAALSLGVGMLYFLLIAIFGVIGFAMLAANGGIPE
jgi:hypothetical protein